MSTSTDYSKKTNADLVEILKSRSLPSTGKKADLVSRLQEDDSKNSGAGSAAPPAAGAGADDVIDWEDDDVPADTTTTTAAKPADANTASSNPAPTADAHQTNETTTSAAPAPQEGTANAPADTNTEQAPAAAGSEEQKPAVDYSRGLPITEMEDELKKRKARAEKFGITEDSQNAIKEAEMKLERAKRFGTAAGAGDAGAEAGKVGVQKLDEALPSEQPRKRQRGRNDQGGGRGGKRRDVGGGRGGRQFNRRGGRGGQGQRNHGQRNGNANGGGGAASKPEWSEKDKQAMEARKKRFEGTA